MCISIINIALFPFRSSLREERNTFNILRKEVNNSVANFCIPVFTKIPKNISKLLSPNYYSQLLKLLSQLTSSLPDSWNVEVDLSLEPALMFLRILLILPSVLILLLLATGIANELKEVRKVSVDTICYLVGKVALWNFVQILTLFSLIPGDDGVFRAELFLFNLHLHFHSDPLVMLVSPVLLIIGKFIFNSAFRTHIGHYLA